VKAEIAICKRIFGHIPKRVKQYSLDEKVFHLQKIDDILYGRPNEECLNPKYVPSGYNGRILIGFWGSI